MKRIKKNSARNAQRSNDNTNPCRPKTVMEPFAVPDGYSAMFAAHGMCPAPANINENHDPFGSIIPHLHEHTSQFLAFPITPCVFALDKRYEFLTQGGQPFFVPHNANIECSVGVTNWHRNNIRPE